MKRDLKLHTVKYHGPGAWKGWLKDHPRMKSSHMYFKIPDPQEDQPMLELDEPSDMQQPAADDIEDLIATL